MLFPIHFVLPFVHNTCVCVLLKSLLSCWLFVTPWTVAHQAPLSMELSRQKYWSGLPCPPPGDLPHPGIGPLISHALYFFYHLLLLLFYFTILYWFCHTSTWIHHRCTHVPHPEPPLPPPSPYHPSGSSQCTSPKLPVSCIKPGLVIRLLYDIIHVLMPFSQIIPSSLSHRVQRSVLYICVSFVVSHTGLSLPSF